MTNIYVMVVVIETMVNSVTMRGNDGWDDGGVDTEITNLFA